MDDTGRVLDPVGSGIEVLQGLDLVTRVDTDIGQFARCRVQVTVCSCRSGWL
jgi:hypothetical protein